MAFLKFLKGNYANLSNAAITEGQILVCGDTGEMFVDVAADKRVKIGDFITVANIATLEALDATAVPTSRLYYVEDGNILARSNGTSWVQVNKQPTAEELKTLLGLGSAAYTDASAYDEAGAAAAVKTYVGDIPNDDDGQPMAASVIAYINKKTDGIATSGNLEALGNRVTTAEGEIDALQEASAKHVEKEDGKSLIADTEIARLTGMSDGANKVEASENGKIKIDGVDTVVYTHPDKHAIADVDGLQDALDGKQAAGDYAAEVHTHVKADITDFAHTHTASEVTDLDTTIKAYDYATKTEAQGYADAKDGAIAEAKKAGTDAQDAVDALAEKVGTVEDGKTVVGMIAEAQEAATYDDTQIKADIKANTDAIDAIEADYLKAADKEALQTQINTIMNNPDAEGAINSINEFTQYVTEHGTIAEGFRTDIDKNKEDIAANAEGIVNLGERLDAAEDAIEAIDNHSHENKSVLDGITAEKVTAWDAAEQNAKDYADGLAGNYATKAQGETADQAAADIAALKAGTNGAKVAEAGKTTGKLTINAGNNSYIGVDPEYNYTFDGSTDITWDFSNLDNAVAELNREVGFIKDGTTTVGKAAEASKTTNKLTVTGGNYITGVEFDGSAAKTLDLSGLDDKVKGMSDTLDSTKGIAEANQAELDAFFGSNVAGENDVTYDKVIEKITAAKTEAIADAEGKVNTLAGNVYTKAEVESLLTWGSF